MRQQINLFQDVLLDKPQPLQARQTGSIIAVFVGLLIVFSVLAYWQLRTANQQFRALQQQKNALETKVLALEQQYPELQKSVQLVEKIEQTKAVLAGQQQLLGYFAGRSEKGNSETIEILEGLARNRSQGVWLRKIALNTADESVSLAGTALLPEQVPQYLQLLGEKKVLSGQVFSRLKLARLQERPGQVEFSLESLAED